jgi:hypothetical protein
MQPLCHLFVLSISQENIPNDWVCANICPVFKKGNRHLATNYRPISLTCIVTKILEWVIYNSIVNFLVHTTNWIQTTQLSKPTFLSNPTLRIGPWLDQILGQGNQYTCHLYRFYKAFNNVPHQHLLLKLNHIGRRGSVLKWISTFLTKHKQRVVVDGHYSDCAPVKFGVPLGTILGRLLFLVYMSTTLAMGCPQSEGKLFADDCVLYYEILSYCDYFDL